jgi:hypothetical protein
MPPHTVSIYSNSLVNRYRDHRAAILQSQLNEREDAIWPFTLYPRWLTVL